MAYQTPKTNWSSVDGVSNNDLNRIEENIRVLSQQGGTAYGVTTGTNNAYAVTTVPAITALSDGIKVSVRLHVDSTGPATLNVNTLGATGLKQANGKDLLKLKANGIYTFVYNSVTGNFIVQGEGGDATDLITTINNIFDYS